VGIHDPKPAKLFAVHCPCRKLPSANAQLNCEQRSEQWGDTFQRPLIRPHISNPGNYLQKMQPTPPPSNIYFAPSNRAENYSMKIHFRRLPGHNSFVMRKMAWPWKIIYLNAKSPPVSLDDTDGLNG